jgi:predicted PurR-regulated permease PerM
MSKPADQDRALRIALGIASMIVIIAGMKAAAELVVPFLLSAFIAIVCTPAINSLQRRGMPLWLSLSTVILAIALVGAVIMTIIGSSIQNFTQQLPEYQDRLQQELTSLNAWLAAHGFSWYSGELKDKINPGVALGFVGKVFNGLGNLLADSFLIFLTVMFLLMEAVALKQKVKVITGRTDTHFDHLTEFLESVNKYMVIKSATSLLTGVLVGLLMWLLGVDYAMLWGLLAFLLNYIPNIGSIIAAIPAVLLALVTAGPLTAIWVVVAYLLVNTLVGNIIEPKFLGDRLGLSTLVVFLSLVFWGWVLGTTGMLLSVPLTMIVKIAMDMNPETRWIAILLGTGTRPKEAES